MIKDPDVAPSSAYDEWAARWRSEMAPMFTFGGRPTVKSLLFLALLEHQGQECRYGTLLNTIREKVRLEQTESLRVTSESLRVAVRDLIRTLDGSATPFRLTRRANGVFQLDKQRSRGFRHGRGAPPPAPLMDFTLDHPLGQQRRLVDDLMSKRVVPPYSLFYLPRSAALWSVAFAEQGAKRGREEARAWEDFGLKDRLVPSSPDVISVVGMAIGEGYGELNLLRRILSSDDGTVVHYLAVDISPGLLLNHMQHLYLEFSGEIQGGRLVCAGVLADMFDLAPSGEKLATKWDPIWRAREMVSADFLPWRSPKIVTYFGNAMGNEDQDSEGRFFELLRTQLGDDYRQRRDDGGGKPGSLHCIVGVAMTRPAGEREGEVGQGTKEKYGAVYRDFFLVGPRRLVECGLLRYDHGKDRKPFPARDEVEDKVACTSSGYNASFGLGGWRHVFSCRLECRIWSKTDERITLEKDRQIQLGAIVEYHMEKMGDFVKEMGCEVVEKVEQVAGAGAPGRGEDNDGPSRWCIELDFGTSRRYGVFCAELARE